MNGRLETILSLWSEVAKKNLDIKHVTLEEVPKRQKRFENAAQNFINDPTEENFLNYWNEKNIFSAARGGAGDQVYEKWRKEDNSIEELAELIEEIRDSDSYKSEWEDKLGGRNTIWEQFGLFHIEEHPPINGTTLKGLEFFGFGSESSYGAYEDKLDNFKKEYLEIIDYATKGTPHEVPLYMEIDKLFNVVTKIKFKDVKKIKNDTGRNFVINILVQRMLNNDLSDFLEEYSEKRKAGFFDKEGGQWEQWKFDHRNYFDNVIESKFSLSDLKPEELESLFEAIEADDSLDQVIPAWLLGGRSGGIGWRGFKKESLNNPGKAADVLSQLFDKDKSLEKRLSEFQDFYESIDTSPGPILGLATYFMMYKFPNDYIFYKYTEFNKFFKRYLKEKTSKGFHPNEYENILDICSEIKMDLRSYLKSPNMIEVHNLIYYFTHGLERNEVHYFWVNQKKEEEIEEGYLQAPIDNKSHHKIVSQLNPGDIVFHYRDRKIIGYSEVEDSYQEVEINGEEKYRVDVELKELDTPIPLKEFQDYLMKDEVKTEKYYPLNKEGRVNQGYLFKLSQEAGEYLKNLNYNQNHYFWISVNPDTWRVSNLDTGEERSYTAYTKDLNKRKVFSSFEKAQPGDKVIFYESGKVGRVVGEGEITKGLHPEEHENYDEPVESISFIYLNPVDGLSWEEITEIPELENSIPVRNNAEGSIFELTEEEYQKLLGTQKPGKKILLKLHNRELDFSNLNPTENLHFPKDIRKEIQTSISAALKSGKNIIFTGPPGTGKTKIAKNVARQMGQVNESISGFIFTTATADWTTFDTIGGYHPKKETRELKFKPGQFLKCFRGKDGIPTNKWLIIDEINRADIDKAFGQLFSVLSKDNVELPFTNDAGEEISIISLTNDVLNNPGFAYEDSSYYVTKNWRLLATMNTYDKASLYEMSYAFMRRFAFIDVAVPTEEIGVGLLEDYIQVWDELELDDFQYDVLEKLSEIWESLNKGKRSIGPAIVKDMLLYIKESEGPGMASALKLYVLPQLEGMVKQNQKELIISLRDHLEGRQRDVLLKAAKERFEMKDKELREGIGE